MIIEWCLSPTSRQYSYQQRIWANGKHRSENCQTNVVSGQWYIPTHVFLLALNNIYATIFFVCRYQDILHLEADHARLLAADPSLAAYFEHALQEGANASEAAKWITGSIAGQCSALKLRLEDSKFTPLKLVQLLKLIDDGTVTTRMARQILPNLIQTSMNVAEYIHTHNYTAISDEHEIAEIVQRILDSEQLKVEQYKQGREKLIDYFLGRVMQASNGRADPKTTPAILLKALRNDNEQQRNDE